MQLAALAKLFEHADELVAFDAILDRVANFAPYGLAVLVEDEHGRNGDVVLRFKDAKGANGFEIGIRDHREGDAEFFGEGDGLVDGVGTDGNHPDALRSHLGDFFGQLTELVATPSSPVASVKHHDRRTRAVDVIDVPGLALLVFHRGRSLGVRDARGALLLG